MTERGPTSEVRSAVVTALAAAAFAIGFVAAIETLSLVLPGARATFRTWGPIATAVAMAAVVVVGLPSALVVEVATAKLGRRSLVTTAVAYLVAAVVWVIAVLLVWRAAVDPGATPAALGVEIVAMVGGALLLWSGGRLAERRPPGPGPVFAFAGVAIVGLAGITAAFLL